MAQSAVEQQLTPWPSHQVPTPLDEYIEPCTPPQILVVADDRNLLDVLTTRLPEWGYRVSTAASGKAGQRLRNTRPDLVVIDLGVGLPLAAADLCRTERLDRVPTLVVASRCEHHLVGKQIDADDFILKPFDYDELRTRIRLILRRARSGVSRVTLGAVVVDFQVRRVTANGVSINVTHLELELLRYLAQHAGAVVSRRDLLRDVWGYSQDAQTRSVDFAILRLRRKVEPNPHDPQFIRTAHGAGYCLSVSANPD